MTRFVTVLGCATAASAGAVCTAMRAVSGPEVLAVRVAGLAALAQALPSRARYRAPGILKDLHVVQRRLEAACAVGPFLPANPAHARCTLEDVPDLLAQSGQAIEAALRGPGAQQQWDVMLRWQPETVLASRRAEIAAAAAAGGGGCHALADAVRAALACDRALRTAGLQAALALMPAALPLGLAGECETGATVMLPRGQVGMLEATLQSLPPAVSDGAEADLHGPMPPISFAALRIDSTLAADVAAAWEVLSLPERVDAATLRLHWRLKAARLHPDHGGQPDAPMAEVGAAFRLLRDMVPDCAAAPPKSLRMLQRETALRMRVSLTGMELAA